MASPKKLTPKKATPKRARSPGSARHRRETGKHARRRVLDTSKKATDKKRGADVDFEKLTHQISSGKCQGFLVELKDLAIDDKGKLATSRKGGSEKTREVRLLKNARGLAVRVPRFARVKESELTELDSYDMIKTVGNGDDEPEDDDLVKFEQGTWKCPKCGTMNKNEAGFCIGSTLQGDEFCNGAAPLAGAILGWGGCFKTVKKTTWTCGNCTTPNDDGEKACVSCGAVRETDDREEENEAPKHAPAKLPAGSIGPGGFSFGSASI